MTNPISGTQATGQPSLPIVLVHGAFVDGSGWQHVHGELVGRGFEVLVAQHPTTLFEGDLAATERLIVATRHAVVLVGHSYGGAVTEIDSSHAAMMSHPQEVAAFIAAAASTVTSTEGAGQ